MKMIAPRAGINFIIQLGFRIGLDGGAIRGRSDGDGTIGGKGQGSGAEQQGK
ncbi:MAG: hypothetical protein M1392_04565 [Gammaproteobacteria bacterium]|nr:hypothetical protein [Gammaproteobacteria bacterium]